MRISAFSIPKARPADWFNLCLTYLPLNVKILNKIIEEMPCEKFSLNGTNGILTTMNSSKELKLVPQFKTLQQELITFLLNRRRECLRRWKDWI